MRLRQQDLEAPVALTVLALVFDLHVYVCVSAHVCM